MKFLVDAQLPRRICVWFRPAEVETLLGDPSKANGYHIDLSRSSPYRSARAASAEENGYRSKSFIFQDVVKKVWSCVGVLQYRCL